MASTATRIRLCASPSDYTEPRREPPTAVLLPGSSQSSDEEQRLVSALKRAGYANVMVSETARWDLDSRDSDQPVYVYELSRATGMLKLVSSADGSMDGFAPPSWIPMVSGEENFLVANGWSFLDPDESESLSAFDIDDANAEGEYRPRWGIDFDNDAASAATPCQISPLGYDLSPLSKEEVLAEADSLSLSSASSPWVNPHSKEVLLHGKTDPPNTKTTCNGYDFTGSSGQSDIPEGTFFTAIGGLPLFSSKDLSPTTASSGWLSFARPLEASHIIHTEPEQDSLDQRIEVVCARSRCHLGHYFGPTEGYCINASALRFLPSSLADTRAVCSIGSSPEDALPKASKPLSWRPLDDCVAPSEQSNDPSPSHKLLKEVLSTNGKFEAVALGCGCFWHVEAALRQLRGVVTTEACYAGGHTAWPTYEDVCGGNTEHAEVVSVVYDPEVCPSSVLIDCFLALHDPTKVRAHGKHALHTGQYRSCVFVESAEMEIVAKECLERCREQLGKDLSTEVRRMGSQDEQQCANAEAGAFGQGWCWRAEDRHQRHDERIKGRSDTPITGLSATEWLKEYGRRTASIVGSSMESSLHPDDDGMAMMMI